MATTDRKPFFKSLPGILTGIAAVITAVTGLYLAFRPEGTNPGPNPPDDAALRIVVQQMASEWVDAMISGDVDAVVRMAGIPYYWDQAILTSRGAIRSEMEKNLAERGPPPDEVWVDEIDVMTIAELREAGIQDADDRILGSLNFDDDDYYVFVIISETGFRGEGTVLVFRRTGESIEMAGFWN